MKKKASLSSRKTDKSGKKMVSGSKNLGLPDLDPLEKIIELMGRHQLGELEWESNGQKLRLKSAAAVLNSSSLGLVAPGAPISAPSSMGAASAGAPISSPAVTQSSQAVPSDRVKQVLSPFVGTFYRAASPTAEYYVREGHVIKRGDVLCIIEAMKLMNEIEAEFPGKVVSVLVENGQPVEFGEPLFLIEAV